MALVVIPITVTQGEDWTYTWIWATPDPSGRGDLSKQTYYNFTGAGARMMVRQTPSSTSTMLLSLASGTSAMVFSSAQSVGGPAAPAFNNALTVTISKAQTLTLSPGTFAFDVFIDWAAGTSQEFLAGPFIVKGSVTR